MFFASCKLTIFVYQSILKWVNDEECGTGNVKIHKTIVNEKFSSGVTCGRSLNQEYAREALWKVSRLFSENGNFVQVVNDIGSTGGDALLNAGVETKSKA